MVQACVRAGAARGLCPAAAAAAPAAKQPQQQRGLRCSAGINSSSSGKEGLAPIRWTRTPSSDHHPWQQQQQRHRRRKSSLRPTASSASSSSSDTSSSSSSSSSTSAPATTSTDDATSTSSTTNGHSLSSTTTAAPAPPPPTPAAAATDNNNNVYRWTDPNPTRPRIAILGGGFGGLYTALQLDQHLPWSLGTRPQILLIDQSDRFVFKPLLYELISRGADAAWEVAPRFQDLLAPAPSVRFLRATVARVQSAGFGGTTALGGPGAGTVTLTSGAVVEYDWLVLALGAEARVDAAPGAREHAVAFATLEDAVEVDRRLLALERARFGKEGGIIRVVVVGSGYSGVELAATVAERIGSRGSVTVVDAAREVCKGAAAGNRVAAEKALAARGVKLDLGQAVTKITREKEGGAGGEDDLGPVVVHLERVVGDGGGSWTETKEVDADLVLWTAGVKPLVPPSSAADGSDSPAPAFPTTGRGQADTDACLRVKGHPRVFAIGDSAAPATDPATGAPVPATAQVAFQQAEQAGYNLWAAITGRRPRPFRYTHLGEMMTLGRYDAAVTPAVVPGLGAVTLDGLAGHAARRVAYLLRLPTAEHRAKVGVSWFVKAAVDGVAAAQDAVAGLLLAQQSGSSPSRSSSSRR